MVEEGPALPRGHVTGDTRVACTRCLLDLPPATAMPREGDDHVARPGADAALLAGRVGVGGRAEGDAPFRPAWSPAGPRCGRAIRRSSPIAFAARKRSR